MFQIIKRFLFVRKLSLMYCTYVGGKLITSRTLEGLRAKVKGRYVVDQIIT